MLDSYRFSGNYVLLSICYICKSNEILVCY